MKCMTCGKGELKVSRENHRYTESGLSNVTLLGVEVRRCPKCGDVEVAIPRIAQLHRAIAFVLAGQRAKLTGAEVRFLRKYLGRSGADFAAMIGVTPETVSRWENDREPMGATAERLLRLMVVRDKPIDEYPNERLAEVAQEKAERGRFEFAVGKSGWHAEAAA